MNPLYLFNLLQNWSIITFTITLIIFSSCKNSIKNELSDCQCLEKKLSDGILRLNKGDDSLINQLIIIGGNSCLLNFEVEVIEVGVIDLPWETVMKNIDYCSENDKTFKFSADSLKVVLQSLIAHHCKNKSNTCSPIFFQNILNQSKGLSRDKLFSRSSICFYTPEFPSSQYAEYNYCYEKNVDYRLKKDSLKIVAAAEYLKSYKNFMAVYTKDRAANRAEYNQWEHDYFHRLWQQSFVWYKVDSNE